MMMDGIRRKIEEHTSKLAFKSLPLHFLPVQEGYVIKEEIDTKSIGRGIE